MLHTPPYAECDLLVRDAGWRMAHHAHTYLQIVHVLSGELDVAWDGGGATLRAGDVHVLPPGFAHAFRAPHGYRQFGLNFAETPDERGLLALLLSAFARPAALHRPRALPERLLEPPPPAGSTERLSFARELDGYCLSLLAASTERTANAAERLLAALEPSLEGPLPVDEFAARVHMSRATLQRLCRARFGCGAARLHEKLRIERAARRLVSGDGSVGDCARQAGYADVYHFSRAFKRVTGLAPRRYRERHAERAG